MSIMIATLVGVVVGAGVMWLAQPYCCQLQPDEDDSPKEKDCKKCTLKK